MSAVDKMETEAALRMPLSYDDFGRLRKAVFDLPGMNRGYSSDQGKLQKMYLNYTGHTRDRGVNTVRFARTIRAESEKTKDSEYVHILSMHQPIIDTERIALVQAVYFVNFVNLELADATMSVILIHTPFAGRSHEVLDVEAQEEAKKGADILKDQFGSSQILSKGACNLLIREIELAGQEYLTA